MIVVDASAVLLGLLSDGEASNMLRTEDLRAPHLADSELAHGLRRLAQQRRITPARGVVALTMWSRMGVRRYAAVGLLPRLWELRDNLSAYDATYVALAEALGCPLLTADRRLAGAPGLTGAVLTVTS